MISAWCAFLAAAAVAQPAPTLAVLPAMPEEGVDASVAKLLDEPLLSALAETGKYKIIAQKDVDEALAQDKARQLRGCNDPSCYAQLADYLKSELLAKLTVVQAGTKKQINFRIIDAKTGQNEERRFSRNVESRVLAMINGVRAAVADVSAVSLEPMPPPDYFVQAWVPSLAQFEKSENWKGGAILGGEVVLVGATVLSMVVAQNRFALASEERLPANQDHFYGQGVAWRNVGIGVGVAALGLYVYNVIDGMTVPDDEI